MVIIGGKNNYDDDFAWLANYIEDNYIEADYDKWKEYLNSYLRQENNMCEYTINTIKYS